MTVAELIELLKRYDGDVEVLTDTLQSPQLVSVLDKLVLKSPKYRPARPAALREPDRESIAVA